ncbi:MAG: TolC family protein, partial [Gemmatimonadetes bacterium]|nr:TolC family protein [Gemmatimonadota bacterium]
PLDVRRAEVQRGQAEVKLLQNRNQVAIAMLGLGQLMGTTLDPSVRLSTGFELTQPHWSADSLVALALSNNPALRAARASSSAARTGIRAARSSYFPTMSLDVGWNGSMYRPGDLNGLVQSELSSAQQQLASCQQGNAIAALIHASPQDCSRYAFTESGVRQQVLDANSGYPFKYTRQPMNAQLTFRLPVFTGLSRQQRVEEARVQAEDAEYQVRSQELKLRVDIGTALRNLETSYQTAQLQAQVVEKATEELRLARERFRLGAGTSVEVSDAQTTLAQAEQGRIDSVFNFHKALASIESMIGQRLR